MTDTTTHELRPSRREFLRSALRGAALVALGGIVGVTWRRNRRKSAATPCVADGLCTACCLLADCSLPLARAHRESLDPR
jgi:hypothetical protein